MRVLDEIIIDVKHAININDADALLRLAAELDDLNTTAATAQANSVRGSALRLRGDDALALDQYHRALVVFEELGDLVGMGAVFTNIGNVYALVGDYPAALELYRRALAIQEELGDRNAIASNTMNIGNVHWSTGDYPAALEYYGRAFTLREESGDRNNMAAVIGNMGVVHADTGDYPQALDHLHRALAIHEELGDRSAVAKVTNNIGIVHRRIGEYPTALMYYRRALPIHEELGDRRGMALTTVNSLDALIEMEAFSEAEDVLATLDAMQLDWPDVRIQREFRYAHLREHDGDFSLAIAALKRALAVALEHGMRLQAAQAHKDLRELAQKTNDFAAYIEHNNEYSRINEEINGKDTATKLAMQEKQREIDAKEREHAKQLAVLHSTLPKHIADRVARGEQVNDHIDVASVMFIDIVGFTNLSSALTGQQVSALLDMVFGICDTACGGQSVTRIKTIGDSYLAFSD